MLTFAGRQDRMELLTDYVREALRRGIIDEWHVWNFSRNEHDDNWLKSRFPVIGRTPDDLIYYPTVRVDTNLDDARIFSARVRAGSDVHIGIDPCYPSAPAYELIIGGWANTRTALRRIDTPAELFTDRDEEPPIIAQKETPGILSAVLFRDIELRLDSAGLTLSIDGNPAFTHEMEMVQGRYDIHVKTGYGATGEWRFPDRENGEGAGEYLYHTAGRSESGWSEALMSYAERAEHYADTVFLKCDDDIVYIQLDELADFIRFRARAREYFLVSANVVNNGVCADLQQRHGAVPRDLIRVSPSPENHHEYLWASATMAADLHNYFLDNRDLFERMPAAPVRFGGRISINFVAWLGRDMSFMSADMQDDEHMLSVQIPGYLGRPNCIYPKLLVSHLTFFPQDEGFPYEAILGRYRKLAEQLHTHPPHTVESAAPARTWSRELDELRNSLREEITRELRDHVTATANVMLQSIDGYERRHRRNLVFAAQAVAASDSARLATDQMTTGQVFDTPHNTLRYALSLCAGDGLALEFGVATGNTLRVIAENRDGGVYGFDSFHGLPESWRTGFPEGSFATERWPEVAGAELVVGLFADVLPKFLVEHPGPVDFLHIDCDLYSSARTVLELVGPRLHPGSVIVFDEYFNYPGWQHHEYRAWQEYVAATHTEFVYEGYTVDNEQVVVRITHTPGEDTPPQA